MAEQDAVVLYTGESAISVEQHIALLRQAGIEAVAIKCTDIDGFLRINFTKHRRVDLLVDQAMCDIVLKGDELQPDVKAKFIEIAKQDKRIYVRNKFPTDSVMFMNLCHGLPSKATKRFDDIQSKGNISSKYGKQDFRQSEARVVHRPIANRSTHCDAVVTMGEQGMTAAALLEKVEDAECSQDTQTIFMKNGIKGAQFLDLRKWEELITDLKIAISKDDIEKFNCRRKRIILAK